VKYLLNVFVFSILLTQYGLSRVWEIPGQCPTIQAGLDSCQTGDTVLVSTGIYYENIVWPNTNGIKFLSQSGPNSAIIDANDSGYVIEITSGIDTSTSISGFTIRNGGWSLFSYLGGGIYLENSSPTIIDNIIVDNSAAAGGGIYCGGNSSPIIKSNVIDRNKAAGSGGILCDTASSAIIIDNIITNNRAYGFPPIGGRGGGINIRSYLQVLVSGNTIANNSVSGGPNYPRGAGIYCENSSPIITGNSIIGNDAIVSSYGGFGGGIYCNNSSPIITHTVFSQNLSITGSIHCADNSFPSIDNCIIINNNSDGIYCSDGSNPHISYSDILDNLGYGLYNVDSSIMVIAEYNWWGDNSGPYHPILNPSGIGNEVSDNVDFEPWLIMVINEVENESMIVKDYMLYHNYPNPFNNSTVIKYAIPEEGLVTLKVFNTIGEEVAELVNDTKQTGNYKVSFDATGLPSGIYFYRLQAGKFVETKKMVLLR
jgi:hypothetical protein